MNIKFWGVRGSIPTPLTPHQVRAKISAAVQRITAADLQSSDSREKFLASLPSWIFGTAGGNTPCVELTTANNQKIIFDAGSGIRQMGKSSVLSESLHYNMFFSHFHWDHIQGLPFFDFAYNPNVTIDIYSPFDDMAKYLSDQMVSPYYPVTWEALSKKINFHVVKPGQELQIDDVKINLVRMNHPGGSYSYSVVENGHKFVYATDVELTNDDFDVNNEELKAVFYGADAVVLDSQYTVEEALRKANWGHSAFCFAVDFAVAWKIKNLYLFHHEPTYDDKKLNSILESARWYSKYIAQGEIKVHLAVEGRELRL